MGRKGKQARQVLRLSVRWVGPCPWGEGAGRFAERSREGRQAGTEAAESGEENQRNLRIITDNRVMDEGQEVNSTDTDRQEPS